MNRIIIANTINSVSITNLVSAKEKKDKGINIKANIPIEMDKIIDILYVIKSRSRNS